MKYEKLLFEIGKQLRAIYHILCLIFLALIAISLNV